jgi:protease PrsW
VTATTSPAPNPAPAPATAEELQRRRDAITVSGWGARFRFVQPHNACFWVYLAILAAGAWYVVSSVASTAGVFAQAYVAAVLSSGAFAAIFLLFLRRFDRFERTPGRLALAAFAIGGLGVPWAIVLNGNSALMSLYTKLFGQAFATDWQAGLSAPFVEETAKGVGFLLLLGLAPLVIRTVYDGLIVGAYVGLGFQVLEDMLYAQNEAFEDFGVNQVDAVLHIFALRTITGISSHALYTALFAAGLIYLLGTPAQPRRVGRGVALVLSALVVHGLWDAGLAIAGNPFLYIAVMVVITVASIVALFVALRWARDREHGWMRDILTPEVTTGVLTEAELTALAGRTKDRRAAVRGRGDGMTRRREKHVLRAARDLAQDLSAAGGEETPQVQHSRAEVQRLRER